MKNINPSDIHIINFYTRCFNFPYEELIYELQHLFRTMETETESEEEYQLIDQVLSIINVYQGEEPEFLREEYNKLFVQAEDQNPLCPITASTFLARYARHYNSERFNELLFESGLHVSSDEMGDTLINQLEYLSMLCDQYRFGEVNDHAVKQFLKEHIIIWIPAFCDVLYYAANLTFYREIAEGLKFFIIDLSERFQ